MPIQHNKYFVLKSVVLTNVQAIVKKDNTKNEYDFVLGILMTLCWLGWLFNKLTRNLRKLAESVKYYESFKSFLSLLKARGK